MRAKRLATLVLAVSTVVIMTMTPGPSWPAVIVGLAVGLAGWVWLQEGEKQDGVTADDTFGRITHPSAWGWDESGRWDEPADGIERPER